MAVDDRHQQRRGVVAVAQLIDVRAGVEERLHRVDVALARREEERRQAALRAHELVEPELPRHARDVRTRAPAPHRHDRRHPARDPGHLAPPQPLAAPPPGTAWRCCRLRAGAPWPPPCPPGPRPGPAAGACPPCAPPGAACAAGPPPDHRTASRRRTTLTAALLLSAAAEELFLGARQPRQVDDLRRRLEVGALREQRAHRVDAVVVGREHQRRLTARGFLRVRIGALRRGAA